MNGVHPDTIKGFLKLVRNKKANHFFFFCDPHCNVLKRKCDSWGDTHPQGLSNFPHCDFPGCKEDATQEFFPNMVTRLKQAEKDIKKGNLYELCDDGKFRKVKREKSKNSRS